MEEDKLNSVEFSVNAKGLWAGKIKKYSEDLNKAYNASLKKAEEMENIIVKKNGLD